MAVYQSVPACPAVPPIDQNQTRQDHRFIRAERLLPEAEIDAIHRDAPTELVRFQDAAGLVPMSERPTMEEWLESFNAGRMEAA